MRYYLLRTYASGSLQPDQRCQTYPRKTFKTCGMVSAPGKAGQPSWLLKDEKELAREKLPTTQRAETVPLVHHCVPAPETEPGT